MTISKYLNNIGILRKKADILQRAAPDIQRDEEASNSVFTTWQMLFDYIRKKRLSAADLLSFISFFNQQGISKFINRHYTDGGQRTIIEAAELSLDGEDDDFEEDMAVLRAFSLVRVTQREDEVEMHRLGQQAIQIWLGCEKADERWRKHYIQIMAQEFPDGE